ncbi:MAG: hypothetical protein KF812_04630 [Fimbriimonadaceae bacterium]|nr:hypothetical protein [Fimbriimonadaceae bacterium]
MRVRFWFLVICAVWTLTGCTSKVGELEDGAFLVATGQVIKPVGTLAKFNGRPVDLAIVPSPRTLVAKDNRGLVFMDPETLAVQQELASPAGASMHGLVVTSDNHIWFSDRNNAIHEATITDGKWGWHRKVVFPTAAVGGAPYPNGMALSVDGRHVWVALSRSNAIALVNLDSLEIESTVEVDIAPYDVALAPDGKTLAVSCWGGAPPEEDERTQESSGTLVAIEENGVAKRASIVFVDTARGQVVRRTGVGLMPTQIVINQKGDRLYVSCANDDSIAEIQTNTGRLLRKFDTRPMPNLDFGSAPNALALSSDERTLMIANGNNNMVVRVDLGTGKLKEEHIPAAWYPDALLVEGERLFIANAKGIGSRGGNPAASNSHHHTGIVQLVDLSNATQNVEWHQLALAQHKLIRRGPVATRDNPWPERIEHVVYVIKENRTYDQILGDMPEGDGEPSLCAFPESITPNHHALAREFVLLDNFYCNGVLSADGHSWATEANATAYLEKSFGGWTRSYPFAGDDPLPVSKAGFIWDRVLEAGLTFRNFGEGDMNTPQGDIKSFKAIYDDFVSGANKAELKPSIANENLRKHSDLRYPGWNMAIPDVLRADRFLTALKEYEAEKQLPNFIIIYLPQDHASGTSPGMPTPRAHVADNDLALGRIVEALTQSQFWPKMAILVTEDDPQAGTDHVDGHRSPCFVISPYIERGSLSIRFANQTSVVRTMLHILGLPPLTQMDAASPLMLHLFSDKPDLRTYSARTPDQPLDQLNPAVSSLSGEALIHAQNSMDQDWSIWDQVDEDEMNRAVWFACFPDRPYPVAMAGAHGRGLVERGLVISGEDDEEEDED